ncbi:hypothetical protein CRG98_009908 [Punica granatum]|uniref:Apple domain-containing protein n=1 Tax=Punica granatum TaxID=22663 RepID=A0A2I0KMQ4_PUNGR|nr:hypothetical protein CRG98_009908 [Punica granatum]
MKIVAGLLTKALGPKWEVLSEEIGLWIPIAVIHMEHNDRPEGEEEIEEEVLPGRPLPPECNAELHTDYDGAAVRWGLTHPKESAADCCQACLDQAKLAKPGQMKCNIWECWLKYAEHPKQNFNDKYSEEYRNAHPTAPLVVPWVAGVVKV